MGAVVTHSLRDAHPVNADVCKSIANGDEYMHFPPLLFAARFDADLCVSALLHAGANVNKMHDEDTALTLACHYGSVHSVRVLLAHGADPNGFHTSAFPLSIAAGLHCEDLDSCDQFSEQTRLEIVQALLAAGASVESDTPLFHACVGGFTSIVRVLLNAGAHILSQSETLDARCCTTAANYRSNPAMSARFSADVQAVLDQHVRWTTRAPYLRWLSCTKDLRLWGPAHIAHQCYAEYGAIVTLFL